MPAVNHLRKLLTNARAAERAPEKCSAGARLQPCRERNGKSAALAAEGSGSFSSEDGSSLVELAMISSILFALLFGLIQIGYAFYAYNYVCDAAREAARYASVRGSTSCTNTPNLSNCNATSAQVQTYVQNLGYPGFSSGNLTVTTTWCSQSSSQPATWSSCSAGSPKTPGNAVNVVVTYTLPFSIPYWKSTTINTSSTAQMVIAQ